MKILFARHGESQANVLHEISNRGLKHPLTQKGRAQASMLAQKLESQAITHIYSSPLLRAIETTVIVATHLGVGYDVADALREYDLGYLEGRNDEVAWREWQEVFDAWAHYRRWERRAEGGESFYDVRDRFVPFIDSLIQQRRDTDANLLCIGHGGLYWMMLPLALKNIDPQFISKQQGFGHTALIISQLEPQGLICREWDGVKIGA